MAVGPLEEHLGYVADPVRQRLFETALKNVVKPGDRVADLGCGSGVLGLMCLRHGAAFVEAIDESIMIEVAREAFRRADLTARTQSHQANSFQLQLDQKVDLLVCDHVGYFGFDYGIIKLLADAKRRFLLPHGRVLPRRLRPLLAAVSSTACREKLNGWTKDSIPDEFSWLRQHYVNAKHAMNIRAEDLLGPPQALADIELGEEQLGFMSWSTELAIERDDLLDGLLGCFEVELADGVWMTNSPASPEAIDRPQAFLPIQEPLPVKAGDRLQATIMVRHADETIAWRVMHPASGRSFNHSTFAGQLLSPTHLRHVQPEHRPRLGAMGAARMTVLAYCDGQRTAAEIEAAVLREHPDLFPDAEEISRFVAATLRRETE